MMLYLTKLASDFFHEKAQSLQHNPASALTLFQVVFFSGLLTNDGVERGIILVNLEQLSLALVSFS